VTEFKVAAAAKRSFWVAILQSSVADKKLYKPLCTVYCYYYIRAVVILYPCTTAAANMIYISSIQRRFYGQMETYQHRRGITRRAGDPARLHAQVARRWGQMN
jgi:hypothetical protein